MIPETRSFGTVLEIICVFSHALVLQPALPRSEAGTKCSRESPAAPHSHHAKASSKIIPIDTQLYTCCSVFPAYFTPCEHTALKSEAQDRC